MKKILGLFAIILCLTGCSTPVVQEVEFPIQSGIEESTQDEAVEESTQEETEDSPQNKVEQNTIEWIVTEEESRAAISLDSVTFEEYKVPFRKGNYIFEERSYRGVKDLERGGKLPVPSVKDYNHKFVTQVRCIEFDYRFVFDSDNDKIKIHDYEGDVVMEVVKYYGVQLEHDEAGWILDKGIIYYRSEGWEIKYLFLNKNAEAMARFYNEHKDGGRFEWNN